MNIELLSEKKVSSSTGEINMAQVTNAYSDAHHIKDFYNGTRT